MNRSVVSLYMDCLFRLSRRKRGMEKDYPRLSKSALSR